MVSDNFFVNIRLTLRISKHDAILKKTNFFCHFAYPIVFSHGDTETQRGGKKSLVFSVFL